MKRLLTIFVLFSIAFHASAATRVALVSTCERQPVEAVLALAEVELGRDDGLALVERAEIQKVLSEQGRCELFDGRRAVVVGRLLSAQLFAVVENYDAKHQAMALVAFDSETGVRLWDEVLPESDAETTARRIAFGVRLATQKLLAFRNGLKTVCLVAVRNVDLPVEKDTVCQSIGALVERQLLNSESIAVLERKRLEFVSQERSLPVEAVAGELVPSLIAMDLEISRNGAGLRGSMTFTDAKETKLGKVSVEEDDPARLASALVEKVAQFLHITAAPTFGDRVQEANRFLREAEFLFGHFDTGGALNAVESAHALNPNDPIIQARLAYYLTIASAEVLANDLAAKRSLRMAARALELDTELRKRPGVTDESDLTETALTTYVRVLSGGPLIRDWTRLWMEPMHTLKKKLPKGGLVTDAEGRQWIEDLKAGLRHVRVDLVAVPLGARATDANSFHEFVWEIGRLQLELQDLSADWVPDILKLMEVYLEKAKELPASVDWRLMNSRVLLQLSCQATGRSAAEQEQFVALLKRMEVHPDPLVQIYGRIGRLHLEKQSNRYPALKTFIRDKIVEPGREPVGVYRLLSYLAALDAIDLFVKSDRRRSEYQDLFEFMLARGEVEVMTAHRVIEPGIRTFKQYHAFMGVQGCPSEKNLALPADFPLLLKNCDRAIALTQSLENHVIGGKLFTEQAGSAEAAFLNLRERLQQPPQPALPWTRARLLYDPSPYQIQRTLITDEMIYVMRTGDQAGKLTVVKVPLSGATTDILGVVPWSPPPSEPCLMNRKLYVWAPNGIVAFDFDSGENELIAVDAGLSFACLAGKLYTGRGSSIVAYDLETRQSRLIASGRRKEAQTPFDNISRPYQVRFMMADAPRQRVIFTTDLVSEPHGGLWQIDTATDAITRLLPLPDTHLDGVHEYRSGHLMIRTTSYRGTERAWTPAGLVDFDLATGKATLVGAFDSRNAGPTVVRPETPIHIGTKLQALLVVDGKLWHCVRGSKKKPGDQLKILSATSPVAETIPAAPEYCGNCGMWDQLRLLPNRKIVAANPCGVWLLELP